MTFHQLLLASSHKINDSRLQMRAEMLSGALLIRQLCLFFIITFVAAYTHDIEWPLVAISGVNLICYLVSRTKYFKLAAVVVIADPILFTLTSVFFRLDRLSATPQVTLSLLIGPLLSSLVLSLRNTVFVIALTMMVFVAILLRIDPSFYRLFAEHGIMVVSVSLVAFVAARLRDKGELALERERAKFLQASKLSALGEMASGVAHELNSPLGAIVLNVELIEAFLADPQIDGQLISQRLAEISGTALRMSKIISGMKNVARDSTQDEFDESTLGAWIREPLTLCQERFHSHAIELRINSENFSQIGSVRKVQMVQALLNLMNNAFDAVQPLAVKWISIEVRASSDFNDVIVSDSGQGVAKDFTERLFEPFSTTKDYGHGTGLGLSVSRGILQSHGGDLIYDPSFNNTTFIMRIPKIKSNEVITKRAAAA